MQIKVNEKFSYIIKSKQIIQNNINESKRENVNNQANYIEIFQKLSLKINENNKEIKELINKYYKNYNVLKIINSNFKKI